MDARTRYTKHVINEEMLRLLGEKPLSKITVTEICQGAEINRATFYKYYDNPYDLMDQMMQTLLDELEQKIVQSKPTGFRDIFYVVLRDIEERFSLYQVLFSTNGDDKFRRRLFSICYGDNIRVICELFPGLSEAKREWMYYFIANGCNGMLMNWIQNGRKESIEEMVAFAGLLVESINKNLRESL